MRVSACVPSDLSSSRLARVRRAAPYGIALAWFLAHIPSLAQSLEDIDSINFALGLHHFDPAQHQPHPPGYPVFIALGKLSLAAVHATSPMLPHVHADALALAIWSAIAGVVAIVAAAALFRAVAPGNDTGAPEWAAALLASAPLFWMTGLRPMSDMSGLAATLAAQALIVRGALLPPDSAKAGAAPRALVAGAAVAGLAAGIRSQAVWLTLPLLVVALVRQRRVGMRSLLKGPVAAYVIAALAWAVPLVVASGGTHAYLSALRSQAGEDLVGVSMLWTDPTPRHLAFALYQTFVMPWAFVPLAIAMDVAAAAGVVLLLLRDRRSLLLLAAAFGPYAVLHLVFQETVTVRYALPLVPAIAYLAVRALAPLGRAGAAAAAVAVAGALVVAVPGGLAYGREVHPAFAAMRDMQREAQIAAPEMVYAHIALRRPLQSEVARGLPVRPPVPGLEWLGPEEYWRNGGTRRVWFLADPRRTDLALIDPESRHDVTHYHWAVADRPELSGTRPVDADWYRFDPPGWFAGEGWALTPETAGIARARGRDLAHGRPIEAFVRRRREPMNVIVGGVNRGAPAAQTVTFELALDGRVVAQWPFDLSASGNFLQVLHLSDGIPDGAGDYARLTIAARAARTGDTMPDVVVGQFNIQPARVLMYGLGDGWHQAEYDNVTGVSWRWTGERSVIAIVPPQAARLVVRGESPLKYFDSPPTLRIVAGTRVLAALRPAADFTWTVDLPAADILSTNGRIALTTDRVYLPGRAEGTGDTRRLGVRLFDIRVNPVDP